MAASVVAGRWFQDTQLKLFIGDQVLESRGEAGGISPLLLHLAVVQSDPTRRLDVLIQQLTRYGTQLSGLLLISPRWQAQHDQLLHQLQRQGVAVRGLALNDDPLPDHRSMRWVDHRQLPQGLAAALQ